VLGPVHFVEIAFEGCGASTVAVHSEFLTVSVESINALFVQFKFHQHVIDTRDALAELHERIPLLEGLAAAHEFNACEVITWIRLFERRLHNNKLHAEILMLLIPTQAFLICLRYAYCLEASSVYHHFYQVVAGLADFGLAAAELEAVYVLAELDFGEVLLEVFESHPEGVIIIPELDEFLGCTGPAAPRVAPISFPFDVTPGIPYPDYSHLLTTFVGDHGEANHRVVTKSAEADGLELLDLRVALRVNTSRY